MAAQVCEGCTTAYSVGAPACPHCGSTDWHGDWEDGGASSPGTSSSTSSATARRNVGRKSPSPAGPAPTTENPSAPDATAGSTAPSTGGGPDSQAEPTSTPDQGG